MGSSITHYRAIGEDDKDAHVHVLQAKSSAEFATKRTLAFIWEIGASTSATTVKSDNELATSAMVTQIGKFFSAHGGLGFSVEMSALHFPAASNDVVER